MHFPTLLATTLATLAAASPIASSTSTSTKPNNKSSFAITDFVYGCTTTCDYTFTVSSKTNTPPSHPSFQGVKCSGSLDKYTTFDPKSCTPINDKQTLSAYIDRATNELRIQYKVNVPSKKQNEPGATYWYEGEKVVGAATGYNPSPPSFKVPVTKAYAIA